MCIFGGKCWISFEKNLHLWTSFPLKLKKTAECDIFHCLCPIELKKNKFYIFKKSFIKKDPESCILKKSRILKKKNTCNIRPVDTKLGKALYKAIKQW